MHGSKKIVFLASLLLVFSGCAQPQKKILPPVQQQPAQESLEKQVPSFDPPVREENVGPKIIRQPRIIRVPQSSQQQDAQESKLLLPSMRYVNDRIFEYGQKLERWKNIDREISVMSLSQEDTERMITCFRDLQKVVDGYKMLHDNLQQRRTMTATQLINGEDLLALHQADIAYLESECGRLLAPTEEKSAGWEKREKSADLTQLEKLIARYAGSREYEEVLQVWGQIPEHQLDRVTLSSRILYANALMFLHQEEKAAEMYQQIVDEMSVSTDQKTDLLSLRKLLADLYTAAGNYLAAENQYELISKDYQDLGRIKDWSKLQLSILERSVEGSSQLTEYSALLRNYLGFIVELDGYQLMQRADAFSAKHQYSPVLSNVDTIRADAKGQADKWFAGFLAAVDKLQQEKKFQEALEKLETMPEDIITLEQREILKAKNEEIVLAEAVERETIEIERVRALERQWDEGLELVKAEEFDKAISLLTSMLETEYSIKASAKITEVSLLAAKASRRKAANLFNRYGKTEDVESQKILLLEARKLLMDILIKYPEVEITDKVLGNIEVVENEMNKLDPDLVRQAETEGSELDSIDQVFEAGATPDIMEEQNVPQVAPLTEEIPSLLEDDALVAPEAQAPEDMSAQ